MNREEKLHQMRSEMKSKDCDGYLVKSSDRHFNEYISEENNDMTWLSGFTGSNGTVIVEKEKALLWTDGRYFIQAADELAGSDIELMKIATPGYPSVYEYIEELPEGFVLGINPYSTSINEYKKLEKSGKDLVLDEIVADIWTDRGTEEKKAAFVHEEKYTGKSILEKLEDLRSEMKDVDTTIISSLEDIAWLYNIRGFDIPNNPYIVSYAVVTELRSMLYVDLEKIDDEVMDHLGCQGVEVYPYEQFDTDLENIQGQNIFLDGDRTSIAIYKTLEESNTIKLGTNLTTNLKAIKNETEIKNQKHAYLKDGVALTKFIYWMKNHSDISTETETTAREKLSEFRHEGEDYIMPSFDTISGYGPNAAMMHYNDAGDGVHLDTKSFYLVDSGGQYLDGTTDITRTIALGDLTEEEIKDYTLVLKGHIQLATTIFLEGTTGYQLDAICRRPLWQHLLDYKCGTGHGVGYLLGVHEGPQSISPRPGGSSLEPGMVVTIEPGVYREGSHGIRTENVYVIEEAGESLDGRFYRFENLVYVPLDIDAIDPDLLDEMEIKWVNDYHKKTYDLLESHMTEEERKWLKTATREL